jgi:hypothetical protein
MCNHKWVRDCHLPANDQFFSYMMARTSYIRGDDDDARFVLDLHALLNLYCASLLKQHSASRHDPPLRHVILISRQPVFALIS